MPRTDQRDGIELQPGATRHDLSGIDMKNARPAQAVPARRLNPEKVE